MRYLIFTLVFCFSIAAKLSAQNTLFPTLEQNIKNYYLMTDNRYDELNKVIQKLSKDHVAVD